MGKSQRDKGARFERQIANDLKALGYDASRGHQSNGGSALEPDVRGIPGVHIECKAVERLNLRSAMEQSERDAGDDEVPIVVHKQNRKEVLVTMRWSDFQEIAVQVFPPDV